MTESWGDYRIEWRCACGLDWQSPIRTGNFRFSCPECRKEVFEIEAAATPGDHQIRLQPGVSASVVRLPGAEP